MNDYSKFDRLIALCNDNNVLYFPDEFIRKIHEDSVRQGHIQLPHPLFVTWDITNNCNMTCVFCSANSKYNVKHINCLNAMRIAEKIVAWDAVYVSIRGGEPTLVYEIVDVVRFFLDQGLFVEIVTNGTYICNEFFKKLGKFEQSKMRVKISCDSYIPEHTDKVRGKGSYKYATAAMCNCQGSEIPFRVQMVICSVNKHDIIDTYKMAEGYGAVSFGPILIIPSGRGRTVDIRVELDEQIIDDLLYIKEHQGNTILEKVGLGMKAMHYFKHLLPNSEVSERHSEMLHVLKCNGGKSRVYVDSVGDVYPCELMQYPEMKMGNILIDVIDEIWQSDVSSRFNSISRSSIPGCKDCKITACDTGCYALVYENILKGGQSIPCCKL